ncbi:Fis family transcriptional regulator [Pseudomonas putida TRO1]|jgi:transcriptional regulator with XRE-family HTH domain|uniref:Fis family transcriptional regulator n=1 Tax=Pseudomonas putida TRO1 TaxID=1227924 RepID=A0AAD2WFE7_PSEPU|nr:MULTISPECIES: helix-turn-helix domain-containing protein [Pseudomonas]ELS0923533.1 helix-turn-helix domain-containing protein [Pseudomonas putida]ENY79699.1 Fis family transcriptional regulator [Pseudomonas putida TRO1]MBH3350359.1 helix-turn-helix domain-containing protein [Pseudomonas putida]UWH21123.1 helix-turn-helix domain-containing protein [Pseudomonas sp. HD6515]HDS0941368.1 helix-turn-helix domain-containing protein [Pseudomonas putida]
MLLRQSFAAVLQLLRMRKGISQPSISKHVDQRTVSKLELAKSSVSLETSYKLASGLQVEATTLIALTVASHDHRTAREILLSSLAEIEALELADIALPEHPESKTPLNVSAAREKLQAVQQLKAKGTTQAEAARELGLPESTVRRMWHQELDS